MTVHSCTISCKYVHSCLFYVQFLHYNMYIHRFGYIFFPFKHTVYFKLFIFIVYFTLSILLLLYSWYILTLLWQTNFPVCGTLKDFWRWFWFWNLSWISKRPNLPTCIQLNSFGWMVSFYQNEVSIIFKNSYLH